MLPPGAASDARELSRGLGARFLLDAQRTDGSWDDASGQNPSRGSYLTVADTCFAILFLARATPPLTR